MQFFKRTFSEETRRIKTELREEIQDEDDSKILNFNKEEYLNYITEKYKLQLPEVNVDDAHIDEKGSKICIYIPYAGDTKNLKFRPSRSTGSYTYTPNIFIQDENIEFRTRVKGEDSKQNIEQAFNTITDNFRENYNNLKKEVNSFNEELGNYAEKWFDKQKEKVKEKKDKFADLDVPVRKDEDASQTFSVPAAEQREKIEVPNKPTTKDSEPEPTLDENTYRQILQTIYDVGKGFERAPRLFEGKEEEDLRDYLLFFLEMNFKDGSATGETFNKEGKTDILLRHEKDNIFVAECLMWDGNKYFREKIDQLLGYLTWRDSKAAVIAFVDNKKIQPVLDRIVETTKEHDNHLEFTGIESEGWYSHIIHLEGDEERKVHLNVQLFHIPKNS